MALYDRDSSDKLTNTGWRVIVSISLTLIGGAISWGSYQLWVANGINIHVQDQVARVDEKIDVLSQQVNNLAAMDKRVTALEFHVDSNTRRIEVIENHRAIEGRQP